jgi:hypothetical protein
VRVRVLAVVIALFGSVSCGANPAPRATDDARADAELAPLATTATSTTSTAELEATTTPATTEPAAPTTTVKPDGSFSMLFSGDTLIHRPIVTQAANYAGGQGYEFAPMFARIAPLVSQADLAVCHMETPVAPPGEALSGHPVYGVPVEVLAAVAGAGYDRCSTASTHALDRGVKGIDATVNGLEKVGLGNSGMARTAAESEPQVFTVRGVKMAHLSYSFGFNDFKPPAGQEWRVRYNDPVRIINDARTARTRGAEFVFVSLHWGEEKQSKVTGEQRALAEKVTASGLVDLIVGHHVHVVQPIEKINNTWVVFGLSNIISNLPGGDEAWPLSSQDGIIATIDVVRKFGGGWDVAKPVVYPTWVDHHGYLVRLVKPDLVDPATPPEIMADLRASLRRTTDVVGDYLVQS